MGNITNFSVFQKPMTNLELYTRNYPNSEYAKTNINGVEVYQLHFGGNRVARVYMQNSKHVFTFYYSDDNTKTAQNILSTFRFTN